MKNNEVVNALVQVRDTLAIVDNGLLLAEAVEGRVMIGGCNSVRSELLLLAWAIAMLSGETALPPPDSRGDQVAVSLAAS